MRDLVGVEAEELTHLFCSIDRQKLIFERCIPDIDSIPEDGFLGIARKNVAYFIFLTIADFAEQLYSWQDEIFGNTDAKLEFSEHHPDFLWPGICKPGLYLSRLSYLGRLLSTCSDVCPIPPVFNSCRSVLLPENEIEARDIYWDVISNQISKEESIPLLERAIELNPFIAEPHLILAQSYLRNLNWEKANFHSTQAITLFSEWGTPWDKR